MGFNATEVAREVRECDVLVHCATIDTKDNTCFLLQWDELWAAKVAEDIRTNGYAKRRINWYSWNRQVQLADVVFLKGLEDRITYMPSYVMEAAVNA